ncbi:efflux RND transporter permease subunit [Pseudomonas aeruginosa]|uniref:efflux RND transporter permease subunit n=1 Tax=Pseudomonas aeruginosa TaxID=287 RepID=UPI001E5E9327|nr:efflux RND transporter permease subunit [Pseudomonas aeruginosa]MCO3518911.1 efflux RND transporter permease subunit [Pseudomonas aeruginosa]MCO3873389.1 efflux RND transporter permease subunit [Pseudomonas aeruginosa]UGR58715.1 efflux RND transporter permease subunit [Pseudomonas aeruginosa]
MSKFFIDRPIFAWVIALVIMLAGGLSILSLPVNQYPAIAPPAIAVQVSYPGASAETVQDTVVQVIEQQMNGIDNLRYISSESNSDGSMTITVTFEQGTDPDIAQVQVQNKLQLATPLLPQEVQRQGIRVTKAVKNFLMVVGVVSTDGSMTKEDLSNYIVSNIQDPLSRTKGVGDFQVFGSQYSMRIWLDPAKLNSYQLTPGDVSSAIQAQNVQISSGQLGGLPAVKGQQLNATIIGKTRLQTAEQFENILLKVNPDGSQVRLKDVADVGLGGQDYSINAQFNGSPASGIAIKLATGANALDTAKAIRQTIANLEPFMPQGMKVVYPYDTTPVVSASIHEVVKTLGEAILLVFLVMYLFLQNFRATLIPTIAVPVVLLGTFGVLAAFGFSINTLTMFGMVLAIGLLVDDAIVVVENVERVMAEEGLSPREAARKSMGQIQGALVGIAMVLSAVFLPMAFFGGSTGVIYRQFSITIVSAMALSVIVALILTPALCATMLKPIEKGDHGEHKGGFFGWFNRMFLSTTHGYERGVASILKHRAPYLLIYVVIVAGMIWMFTRIPTAFLPDEDQGVLFAQVQTPPGSSAERTQVVVDSMREYLLEKESSSVSSVFTVTGFNFAGRGQSSGMAFIMLKPWEERPGGENSVFELAKRAQMHFFSFKDAMVFAFAPPSVLELGNATGFDLFLQDQAGVGHEVLLQARNKFLMLAAQNPALQRVRPNGMSDEPQYKLEILGEPAPGLSSGDAMAAVEEIVKQLPKGVGYSWTGLSYEERLSGSQAPALYALSLLVVFLCLAALYESWSIPFSVMLVVPLGVIGALLATSMRGLSNDVFFQVGLLTTIGLSAKNAILIVEFAKELHEQGKGIVEAAIEACRMRLRPIVMTSLAFILGVVPLAISTGAGSGSQHAIGTGVIGGMVTATVLAIFWVPLFYVAVSTLFKDEASKQQASVEKGQ